MLLFSWLSDLSSLLELFEFELEFECPIDIGMLYISFSSKTFDKDILLFWELVLSIICELFLSFSLSFSSSLKVFSFLFISFPFLSSSAELFEDIF